jgi:large subunit ribosomal protein L3
MINALLGIKKSMTSTYDARGRRVGATVIEVDPNFVTQVKKTDGKDGYEAVQLGVGTKKSVAKAQVGHAKKAGVDQKIRWFREIRVPDVNVKAGEEITVGDVFKAGDAVKVTGTSRGRGFQGGVKRYGFSGGPKTHGQSDRHRAPGSIGSGTTPGRVFKGKRMAGHMGVDTVSVKGLEVIKVDKKNNLLTVKGGVPGPAGSLLMIYNIGKIKGYIAPPEEKEDEEEGVEKPENQMKSEDQKVSESESQSAGESDNQNTETPTDQNPDQPESEENK